MASHLLALPAELREIILLDVVRQDQLICPRATIPRDAWTLQIPSISKVCQQLRAEGLGLHYSRNTFAFPIQDVSCSEQHTHLPQDLRYEHSLLTYHSWCAAAGPDNVRRIRDFRLVCSSGIWLSLSLYAEGKFRLTPSERPLAEGALTRVCRGVVGAVQEILDAGDGKGLWPKDLEFICMTASALYTTASRGLAA
ncbi:hypothetical protein B0A50_05385 [Salinomyces thailandicus]|uniref:F-box domain-containing protein n=1 Tax=Salinomyces thailandicus TaxID=706561 RepID=A0A4U0TTM0_9PEZI|nr:hypothetical protein B0A50_05385 [Salinomyces thailandica]